MTRVDLDGFELQNIERDAAGLAVRRGLVQHVPASTFQPSSVFVAGFSLEAQNTGEVAHYLFLQSTTTRMVTLYMTDDEYNVNVVFQCGVMPKNPTITYAVQDGRILINSPGLHKPIYGLLCGGLIEAVKVASTNPDTTALEIPTGICCSWGDRIVIAQGNLLFVNDPGLEVRTFVAENVIALPANIYALFESAGALVAVTSDGVFSLPQDALGQGQLVQPFIGQPSTYGASSLNNAAISRSVVACLTKTGLLDLATGVERKLVSFGLARALGAPVGVPSSGDFRHGTVWPSESGYWVSIGGALCHAGADGIRWVTASVPLSLVGVLRSREGADILLMPERIAESWGNIDFTASTVSGVASGRVPSASDASLVVRFVTTASDAVGGSQSAAIAGEVRTATTLAPPGAGAVIATSTWGAGATYRASPLRSRRHAYAVRTDDLHLEVAASRCRTRIGPPALEMRGQGVKRP